MKGHILKRVLALALVFILAPSILPVGGMAANVDDFGMIYDNFNTGGVANGPPKNNFLTPDTDFYIQSVTTYHWNSGQGSTPGSISLYLTDGTLLGTWQATGRPGYRDVPNAYWDIFPNIIMEAGTTYCFKVSDNDSWSYNSESDGCGFIDIRGRVATQNDFLADTPPAEDGFKCSDWAKTELAKAENLGLIPDSLREADLTRPVSRAEFAAISVKAYEYMSGTRATVGSDPFTDTSDEDILKAYNVGITNGTSATAFSPQGLLTREQAATMLTRAYKKVVLPGWSLGTDSKFTLEYTKPAAFADDGQISDYARNSVYFMSAKGIIKGVGGNKFAPKNTTSAQEASRYANATREQAIIIAARMATQLDTSQKPVTPETPEATPGQAVPAKGKVGISGVAVDFGSSASGSVKLSNAPVTNKPQEDSGIVTGNYTMELTAIPTAPVTVSLDLSGSVSDDDNHRQFIFVEVPYVDGNSNDVSFSVPVEAEVSGNTLTAQVDLAQFENYLERVHSASPVTYIKADRTLLTFGLWGSDLYYQFVDGSHFCLLIPDGMLKKFSISDATNLLSDMETLLDGHVEDMKVYDENLERTAWPMDVHLFSNTVEEEAAGMAMDGYYEAGFWSINDGAMYLNRSLFFKGYKSAISSKTDANSLATVAHELFHFVQDNLVSKFLTALWFDEATAIHAEIEAVPGTVPPLIKEYGRRVYDGVVPEYTSNLANRLNLADSQADGYGRGAFIQYLESVSPRTALSFYTSGGVLDSSYVEDAIERLSGKTLSQLTEGFFTTYLTTGRLVQEENDANPWMLWEGYNTTRYKDIVSNLSFDASGYQGGTKTVTVPRYGARMVRLDVKNIPADVTDLTFSLAEGEGVKLMVMSSKSFDKASVKYYKQNSMGVVNLSPTVEHIVVALINTSDTKAEATLQVTPKRDSAEAAGKERLSYIARSYNGTQTNYNYSQNSNSELKDAHSITSKQVSVNVAIDPETFAATVTTSSGATYYGTYNTATGRLDGAARYMSKDYSEPASIYIRFGGTMLATAAGVEVIIHSYYSNGGLSGRISATGGGAQLSDGY